MHFKQILKTILSVAAISSALTMSAEPDAPVKSEFRSVWLSTVWRLDYPTSVISTTGSVSQINVQKNQLAALLDSLAANNFNAVCFQVRGRADAFYKSSYEPWSSDLVKTRGMDPGWDPFEWAVAEAHKRGLECHAWVNPFRYESVKGAWDGLPGCYRTDHPDWLLDITASGTTSSIFNPGKAEVREHLVKIMREIVQNYDIDGLMFDDYFYKQGTYENGGDDAQYNEYKAATTDPMSLGDWRRENINQFVADVYNMVQEEKPWVRFGIGPPGVAASDKTVAAKYGVTPSPGSDWQYNGQYSDVLAWISRHIVDYITPQLYWTIGHTTNDYSKLSPWWSVVADKFGRHFYSSNSISSLTASSKIQQQDETLDTLLNDELSAKASGPNGTTFEEYANEIRENRNSTIDGNPGVILFRAKYVCTNSVAKNFGHYLRNTVFGTKSIIPAMGHKPQSDPGIVSNLTIHSNVLSWDPLDNSRVTVYAIPTDVPTATFDRQGEYLLGICYDSSYTIPEELMANHDHYFAVCIYDRYGFEYAPVLINDPAGISNPTVESGISLSGSTLIINLPESHITVAATAIDGRQIATLYNGQHSGVTTVSLSELGHGAYIVTVGTATGRHSLKVLI